MVSEFADLCKDLKSYLDDKQIAEIEQAYLLAKKAHETQKRSSGEPYITHPVAVAKILAKKRLDKEGIIAALLHDVIEDTKLSKEVIAEQFGKEVAELVDGVSKLTQIEFESKAEAQAANFRKMMMAMSKDLRVILIKLADRLHNMRTLDHLPPEKRHRIARETLEIYAPIANRLGIRAFRDEFQDRSFYCLYPLRYEVLRNSVRNARGNRKEIIVTIEEGIRKSLLNAGISEFELRGREKNLYSIYKKMRDKRLHFTEVMDVYGFRIIVSRIDLCYRALGAVHNLYKPVPERFKDYIAIPKANGYQSLHTTLFGPYGLPIEIQIRTREMHKMAENGIAAHWLYKSEEEVVNQAQLRAREWIKGLMEIQQSSGDSLEFIETVKIDLFPDEVYVFTPQGDIFELPSGATAVDFAYAVHSDIGNSCVAVKIDKRLVPLSTRLKSGQTIEVITAPGARPNPAWLNFVVTGKAKGSIRHVLKKQRRRESINFGKRLLQNALSEYTVNLEDVTEEQFAVIISSIANCKSVNDLFEAIGLGNQMAPIVAQRLIEETAEKEIIKREKKTAEVLMIKGTEGMAVSFAECCYPIPGDSIEGVLTSGRGIVIHNDQCKVLNNIRRKTPEQCVPILWQDNLQKEFHVKLETELFNRRRSLALLASAIADAESNIEDVTVHSQEGGYAKVKLTVTVMGRAHLARVLRRVRQVNSVVKIARIRNNSKR